MANTHTPMKRKQKNNKVANNQYIVTVKFVKTFYHAYIGIMLFEYFFCTEYCCQATAIKIDDFHILTEYILC